jgi:hypothetical protein
MFSAFVLRLEKTAVSGSSYRRRLRPVERDLLADVFLGAAAGNCSDSFFSMDSLFVAGTTLCHAVIPVTGLYSAIKKPS